MKSYMPSNFPSYVRILCYSVYRSDQGSFKQTGKPLIVKPVDGHGGAGIFMLRPDDRNVSSILETLTAEGEHWIVAQEYLPAARDGDKRIIMIDGQPHGAILRIPQENDNRGNIHVGGRVVHSELTGGAAFAKRSDPDYGKTDYGLFV